MEALIGIALAALAAAAIVLFGSAAARRRARGELDAARREAARLVEAGERDAEARRRDAELTAKELLLQARAESENAARERRSELEAVEKRLGQRESALDQRLVEQTARERELGQRARALQASEQELASREQATAQRAEELERLRAAELARLEQIAGLTAQQARDELIAALQDAARLEAAQSIKRIEDEAREAAEAKANWLMALATQRLASDYVSETTVSVVELPTDEMKGRIIGREGRNIRALEMATGIDLIVDDTPEAVILSGFDPYRREIARVALERLIADGRIHPVRIEEVVEKVKGEFEKRIQTEGEAALLELKIPGMHPELVKLLGRLRYRSSYGQNVLHHSKEVSFLAATMAAELGVDVQVAKRAGLLHDIGKAIDREVEGTHLELGIELLRKYGESEKVVHAMACHHGDYDPQTVEAVLVTAADALSAARPGARREVLETYVARLEKLEALASGFKGVEKSFAVQAGREIRVIVDSGKLGDEQALWLAKDLAKKIEQELTYPGQIRVTVIREMRAVEHAK
jgi:ribonuclease Y